MWRFLLRHLWLKMTDLVVSYTSRLTFAGNEFIQVATQIPTGRHHVIPLPVFGEWSVARILFHMVWYETNVIWPLISNWGEQDTLSVDADDEAKAWQASQQAVPTLIVMLEDIHGKIVRHVGTLTVDQLAEEGRTPWGQVQLGWVLLHLHQILLEYTSTLLSMVLYWDQYLAMQKQIRLEQRDKNEPGWVPTQDTPSNE